MCQLLRRNAQLFQSRKQRFYAVYAGKDQPIILAYIFQRGVDAL